MKKLELVKAMAAQTGATQKASGEALEAVLAALTNAMKSGEKISITGFGTFEAKEVAAKNGVNPQTGEAIVVPAHKRVSFKPSKTLKETVNE